jgi:hypothetical protein
MAKLITYQLLTPPWYKMEWWEKKYNLYEPDREVEYFCLNNKRERWLSWCFNKEGYKNFNFIKTSCFNSIGDATNVLKVSACSYTWDDLIK